jgi:hypothetical protein
MLKLQAALQTLVVGTSGYMAITTGHPIWALSTALGGITLGLIIATMSKTTNT